MRCLVLPTLTAALALPGLLGGTAYADPGALAEAVALAADARFEAALAAFERADDDSLAPAEQLRLHGERALVHHALGDLPAMRADLEALLTIDRDATLPPSAPPPVRGVLEELRDALPETPPSTPATPPEPDLDVSQPEPTPEGAAVSPTELDDDAPASPRRRRVLIGLSAAGVGVLAVVLAITLSRNDERDTALSSPMVRF